MFLKFNQKTSYFHKQEVVTKFFMNNLNFVMKKFFENPYPHGRGSTQSK